MAKMTPIRKAAKGQPCMVRLPLCNDSPETTVLAHMPGSGWGAKSPDFHAAFACSACHDEVDRRTTQYDVDYVGYQFLLGVVRTQRWLLENGYIAAQGVAPKLGGLAESRLLDWAKSLAA